MRSLNICSPFTNVTLDDTTHSCLDKLYFLHDPPTLHVPRAVLYKLSEFVTKRNHFLLHGQYYDQIDGTNMGSLLSPVLANMFMCHFEERWVMNMAFHPRQNSMLYILSYFLHFMPHRTIQHPTSHFWTCYFTDSVACKF